MSFKSGCASFVVITLIGSECVAMEEKKHVEVRHDVPEEPSQSYTPSNSTLSATTQVRLLIAQLPDGTWI